MNDATRAAPQLRGRRLASGRVTLFALVLSLLGVGPDLRAGGFDFEVAERSLKIIIDGTAVATYVFSDDRVQRPHFREVRERGGLQVTRPYPPPAGDDDHADSHPGLWLGYGRINGKDFWRNNAGMRVEHVRFTAAPAGGGKSGSFAVLNRYVAHGEPVCEEACKYTLALAEDGWLLGIDSTFSSTTGEIRFGDQQEMGLGVRLAPGLDVERGGRMIDGAGRRGEKGIWGRPADWCDAGGVVGGRDVGIALMAHPENFRRSRMHARDYGLLVVNPFGRRDFGKGEESVVVVKRAKSLRLRFGVFVHGSSTPADIPSAYKKYLSLGPLSWNLRDEFRIFPELTNPVADRHGNGMTWHFLRTTGAEGPPGERRWLRDGRYVPLARPRSKRLEDPLDGWILGSFPPRPPSVGRYRRDQKKGLQLRAGDVLLEPGAAAAVVVAWRSPVSGVAEIRGVFEHADDCCGDTSAINWYVERGPAPDSENGFEPVQLASGTAEFGTDSQRGEFHITRQNVEPGDFVYFIADARADGTESPQTGDGTRFDVTITVADTVHPPTPTFERDVLPILARNCHSCHGADKQEAQLDLRTVGALLRRGASGRVVVRGHPEKSILVDMMRSGAMPPGDGKRLHWDDVETVWRWIRQDHAAMDDVALLPPKSAVSEADRQFWAFQKPRRRAVPDIKGADRARTPVDRFLASKLETKGLAFSADASPTTLVRRAFFDLIGLPPSPEDVTAFVHDERPDAYERLIDRLLASPHYGERWGRHWLDAAGYVDNAVFDGDLMTIIVNDGIWRYRDYVIRSLNADKPYDKFVTEQLAGDELVDWKSAKAYTPANIDRLVATGYLRSAEDHTDAGQYGIDERFKVVFRVMETVSTGLMGMTLGCARCHDHKYDPIPQRDYYRLMACFMTSFNVYNAWIDRPQRNLADIPPAERKAIDERNTVLDAAVKELEQKRKELEKKNEKTTAPGELEAKIRLLKARRESYGIVQALCDVGPTPVTRVLNRGDFYDPGIRVEPGFPTVLTTHESTRAVRPPDTRGGSSGRRLSFARWLTRLDNPVAARVYVNRIWHHLFGRGIVATPGNFGRSGSPPTHPELLDWLAIEFTAGGWSTKRLQRMIMTSTAYRQSSRRPSADEASGAEGLDPGNQLLWRMNLRRLESEIIRDAALAVGDTLDATFFGPPVKITNPPTGLSTVKAEPAPSSRLRRSVYVFARRVYPLSFLETFDSPIMPVNCTRRNNTATTLQSLTFLNSEFVLNQADEIAARVLARAGDERHEGVREAFLLVLSRDPTSAEHEKCAAFLAAQARMYDETGSSPEKARQRALGDLCHMLLCANEFLYVE